MPHSSRDPAPMHLVPPPMWQEDRHGRVFYVDHTRRLTQWHRPDA